MMYAASSLKCSSHCISEISANKLAVIISCYLFVVQVWQSACETQTGQLQHFSIINTRDDVAPEMFDVLLSNIVFMFYNQSARAPRHTMSYHGELTNLSFESFKLKSS